MDRFTIGYFEPLTEGETGESGRYFQTVAAFMTDTEDEPFHDLVKLFIKNATAL